MELSIFLHHPHKPNPLPHSLTSISIPRKEYPKRSNLKFPCRCSLASSQAATKAAFRIEGRRALMGCFLAAAAGVCVSDVAGAASTSRRALRGAKVPESDYTTLPNGLKYYDLKVGKGAEAVKGSRVADI